MYLNDILHRPFVYIFLLQQFIARYIKNPGDAATCLVFFRNLLDNIDFDNRLSKDNRPIFFSIWPKFNIISHCAFYWKPKTRRPEMVGIWGFWFSALRVYQNHFYISARLLPGSQKRFNRIYKQYLYTYYFDAAGLLFNRRTA